jgi:hypothetical protein
MIVIQISLILIAATLPSAVAAAIQMNHSFRRIATALELIAFTIEEIASRYRRPEDEIPDSYGEQL